MYSMSQPQYIYAPPAPTRQYAGYGTSSAFSASANPDEDWTKISDLAERRRIQNRIAQRNYRKKLKKRLEDLERRARSSDGESSPTSSKAPSVCKSAPAAKSAAVKKSSTPSASASAKKARSLPSPQPTPQTHFITFSPPTKTEDSPLFGSGGFDTRERSHTPPSLFPQYTYPGPDDFMSQYGATMQQQQQQQFRPLPAATAAEMPYTTYLAPPTIAAMAPATTYGTEDDLAWNYGFVSGLEYDHQSNPQTPPLSQSFEHSTNCSDNGYEYPTTPLSLASLPGSPPMI